MAAPAAQPDVKSPGRVVPRTVRGYSSRENTAVEHPQAAAPPAPHPHRDRDRNRNRKPEARNKETQRDEQEETHAHNTTRKGAATQQEPAATTRAARKAKARRVATITQAHKQESPHHGRGNDRDPMLCIGRAGQLRVVHKRIKWDKVRKIKATRKIGKNANAWKPRRTMQARTLHGNCWLTCGGRLQETQDEK